MPWQPFCATHSFTFPSSLHTLTLSPTLQPHEEGGGGGGGVDIMLLCCGGLHGLGLVIECYHIDIRIHVCSLPPSTIPACHSGPQAAVPG